MRSSFHARLTATLLLTLAALGALQFFVLAGETRRWDLNQDQARQRADAVAVTRTYTITVPGGVPLNNVNRYLRAIQARPGTDSAELVDNGGERLVAGTVLGIGLKDPDSHVRRALVTGKAYGGHADDYAQKHGHMIFVTPVRLPGQKLHALVVRQKRSLVDSRISDIRATLIFILLGGGLLAIPAFYFLGGRSLGRLHHVAVQRATRDGLTDLANHRAFQDELDRALSLARRHGEPVTLALYDIDDFRFQNDRFGHGEADLMLQAVADSLRGGRTEDRAFRVGGDEFALILPHTDEESARVAVSGVIERLPKESEISVSVGLAAVSAEVGDAVGMRAQADAALLEAKRRGGGATVGFSEVEDARVLTAAKVRAVRGLLADPEVDAAYQPILDVNGRDILGYEGLARPNAKYPLDGPGEAFDVAGAIGRSSELDAICRRAVLSQAKRLPEGALLFVNVAPQSLDDQRADAESLAQEVREAGFEPERVVLEVTERFSGRIARLVGEAHKLRAAGFKLALDDVGAGNSGLQMLRELEFDFVKIDREVLVRAMSDATARGVLVSITAFAAETGAYVIAEGIEDEAMWKIARDPGVGQRRSPGAQGVQGYFFGRPGPLPSGDTDGPPSSVGPALAT